MTRRPLMTVVCRPSSSLAPWPGQPSRSGGGLGHELSWDGQPGRQRALSAAGPAGLIGRVGRSAGRQRRGSRRRRRERAEQHRRATAREWEPSVAGHARDLGNDRHRGLLFNLVGVESPPQSLASACGSAFYGRAAPRRSSIVCALQEASAPGAQARVGFPGEPPVPSRARAPCGVCVNYTRSASAILASTLLTRNKTAAEVLAARGKTLPLPACWRRTPGRRPLGPC